MIFSSNLYWLSIMIWFFWSSMITDWPAHSIPRRELSTRDNNQTASYLVPWTGRNFWVFRGYLLCNSHYLFISNRFNTMFANWKIHTPCRWVLWNRDCLIVSKPTEGWWGRKETKFGFGIRTLSRLCHLFALVLGIRLDYVHLVLLARTDQY